MEQGKSEWTRAYERMIKALTALDFPAEIGEQIARQLGSPGAMDRMSGYLYNVKPHSIELVVDEMLAIRSEIEAWREKKACEEANARYNELLYYGLSGDDE